MIERRLFRFRVCAAFKIEIRRSSFNCDIANGRKLARKLQAGLAYRDLNSLGTERGYSSMKATRVYHQDILRANPCSNEGNVAF